MVFSIGLLAGALAVNSVILKGTLNGGVRLLRILLFLVGLGLGLLLGLRRGGLPLGGRLPETVGHWTGGAT